MSARSAATFVVAIVVGALLLGGPVRAITSWPLGISTLLAALVGAGCAALFDRVSGTWVGAAWVAVLASVAVATFAASPYGPLAGWVGSDGGIHLSYRNEFVARDPHVYASFVSFYAFTWCVEALFHCDAQRSFAAGVLVVVGVVGAAMAWSACSGAVLSGSRAGRIAAVVASVALLFGLALPVVGYYQLDGFFAQLWILVPLVLVWLLDRSGLSRARTALLFIVLCVAARYTYGLVLGDLAMLGLVLVVREARRDPEHRTVWIIALVVTVLGVIAFEWRFFRELVAVVERYGWFVKHDFPASLRGAVVASLALLTLALVAPAFGRTVVVPLTIVLTNTTTLLGLHLAYPGDHYYVFKYDFHALVLMCMAAAAASAFVVGGGLRARRGIGIAALVVLLLGLAQVGIALEPMRVAYTQRLLGGAGRTSKTAGSMRLASLVDGQATRRMRQVLALEHAEFGGYLVAWGPMFNFVNAMFWRWNGGYFEFQGVDERPGHCVFWTHRKGKSTGLWDMTPAMKKEEARLDALPGSRHEQYRVSGEVRDLSYACWPATEP